MGAKPIPDNYRRVTPSLVVKSGEEALRFYAEVFVATERARFPGPGRTIAHAKIELDDSMLIVEDEFSDRGTKAPAPSGVEGTSFPPLYVKAVDAVIEKAVKLAAKFKRPAENQFYGDRGGYIVDPLGIAGITSHIEMYH